MDLGTLCDGRYTGCLLTSSIFDMCRFTLAAFTAALVLASTSLPAEDQLKFSKRKEVSLKDRCDILSSQGKLVMVPKGSILFIPDSLKSKVITSGKPTGKLITWNEFLALNGTWIHMFSVTFDQASGKAKIPQDQLESLGQLNKIVVARRGKNIISVSPKALEPPEKEKK